jgi:hypothetical protein
MVYFTCQCGADLGEAEPGEITSVPECDACEKADAQGKDIWPTTDVLLAVYGAPFNWPVEPAVAA